jgi:hypothetical protein
LTFFKKTYTFLQNSIIMIGRNYKFTGGLLWQSKIRRR